MGCKKQGGAKNWVIVIQKEKRSGCLFSFWIKMTLFICTLLFATHILDLFLKVPDPKKISGRPDKLEWWVQIDWANICLTSPKVGKVESSRGKIRRTFAFLPVLFCRIKVGNREWIIHVFLYSKFQIELGTKNSHILLIAHCIV